MKKAGLPYGTEYYVEVKGFLAKHYGTLLDLVTVGFYKKIIKDAISKMGIQPNDRILDMGAGTGRNDLLMLGYLEEGEVIGLEIGEEMKKHARTCVSCVRAECEICKLKVNDIEMYYEVHGEGEPIVFLHGF